jgi:hypothetical protein
MMAQRTKTGQQDDTQLLFISQDTVASRRENLKAIVSHARKTQTKLKYKHKRASAQRDATYARSLVGWRQGNGPGMPTVPATSSKPRSKEPASDQGHESRPENRVQIPVLQGTGVNAAPPIGMSVRGGLRQDPFGCFPLDDSKENMQLIDFCGLQPPWRI